MLIQITQELRRLQKQYEELLQTQVPGITADEIEGISNLIVVAREVRRELAKMDGPKAINLWRKLDKALRPFGKSPIDRLNQDIKDAD